MRDASALPKADRFGQLLETLNQSELAMTSYELADMCWLLLNAPQIEELSKSKSSLPTESKQSQSLKLEKQEAKSKKSDKQSPPPQNNSKPPERTEKSEDAGLYPRQPQSQTRGDTLTFPVDNPTDLGSSLALAKALKGLLRQVPALNQPEVLDEISTVDNYAATNKAVLTPFFQPALEPWLDIALVVDGNFSLDIWHQTIDDLILFLRNYGIFRDVLICKLVCEQEKLLLYKGLKIANARIANPKELLSPSGRRIIIVLSDCVADYWRNGKVYSLLNEWQKINPVAILQMLPEWLWLKTGLGEGAKVTLFSDEPETKNQQLRIKDILLWEDVFNNSDALKIPVFTLESKSLEQWSNLVVGRSDTKVAGFVLAPTNNLDKSQLKEFEAEEDLNAKATVLRFRNNSSPLAQELAELLAAAPTIFLPVVRLIRREILPQVGQIQIAEVFLGGILRVSQDYPNSEEPDLVLYDFISPEVRKVLQTSSTRSISLRVYERVSRYIAERIGIELRDFLAELKKPPEEINPELGNIIYPFAKVSKQILLSLGGDYARFAREELKAAGFNLSGFPPLQDLEYESAKIVLLQGIELQTEKFEVAEFVIEPEIYETFEFVTAKLERKPKGLLQRINILNRDDDQWEIKRQTRQGKQLIEQLSEEVTLEMVLIPPGEFMMGDSDKHQVNIGYSFLMGKYPVTQVQWQVIMGNNPSRFKGNRRPVEQITWYKAQEFCQRLSQQTGRKYRLPSEAEWEYACRGGTNTSFHFGETISTELANYRGTDWEYEGNVYSGNYGKGKKGIYREETTEVGSFPANNFGLCDMHGNVWEWCKDDWHDNYEGAPTDGSAWVDKKSSRKVIRGGSWICYPYFCRSASRYSFDAENDDDYNIGFRVVCEVPRTL